MPDGDRVGEEGNRDHHLDSGAHEIGRDHHCAPGKAICPHAPNKKEDHPRGHVRAEDETEVPGSAKLEHRERERNWEKSVPYPRERAAEPEEPELTLGEDPQPAAEAESKR